MIVSLHQRKRTIVFGGSKENTTHWIEIRENEIDSQVIVYFDDFQQAVDFRDMIDNALMNFTMESEPNVPDAAP